MEGKKPSGGRKKKIIIAVLSLILVICIGIIVSYYYKQYKADKEYNKLKDTATVQDEQGEIDKQVPKTGEEKQKPQIPVNFEELWKTNTDIYGWIEIPDTEINYPILQSVNDFEDYYLDHTVERASGLPGAIYTRMDNAKDFSDANTVIYGHNMKNGTMFADLHKYESLDYWEGHPYIYIYTPEQVLKYEIFASVTYSDELILSKYDFTTDQGLLDYAASLKEGRGMSDHIKEGVEIKPKDKLITLSTCINSRPTNRLLVVAVLRNEE